MTLAGDCRKRADLCRRLGKKTLAEGVETEEWFDYLLAIGCDETQGYYLMRPQSAAQTRDILLKHFDIAAGYMVIESAARVSLREVM